MKATLLVPLRNYDEQRSKSSHPEEPALPFVWTPNPQFFLHTRGGKANHPRKGGGGGALDFRRSEWVSGAGQKSMDAACGGGSAPSRQATLPPSLLPLPFQMSKRRLIIYLHKTRARADAGAGAGRKRADQTRAEEGRGRARRGGSCRQHESRRIGQNHNCLRIQRSCKCSELRI